MFRLPQSESKTKYSSLKSKPNLFARVSAVKLIRHEGHRLPIVAMQEMNIQKNDKILFLYYPKKYFLKYYNDSDYVAYSINKYNFADVLQKGTTYDAYKNGHELYKVFF